MRVTRGFTLIELIIYVGLFGLLIGGSLIAVNQIFQASGKTSGKATVQDEQNFVLRKISWTLNGIDPKQEFVPAAGYSETLSIHRHDGTHVMMRLVSGTVEISEDGGANYLPLTTDNVTVEHLGFAFIAPSGSGPGGITASSTISGLVASTTRYIRQ